MVTDHDILGLSESARVVSAFFADVFAVLHDWREQLEQHSGTLHGADLDELVAGFALPVLDVVDPVMIGAGFIGDPRGVPSHGEQSAVEERQNGESQVEQGNRLHFAWWLGPLPANPLLSKSDAPNRLDITARGYAEYVSDYAELEWYRVPETTRQAHVTGPYVDYLCTCDYILTVTAPVQRDGEMFGVVGADVFVRRLERAVMPALLAIGSGAAVVNESGRVVVSTDLNLPVGSLLSAQERAEHWATEPCSGAPFAVVARR